MPRTIPPKNNKALGVPKATDTSVSNAVPLQSIHANPRQAGTGGVPKKSNGNGRKVPDLKKIFPFPKHYTGKGRAGIYDDDFFPPIAYAACREFGCGTDRLANLFGVTDYTIEHWKRTYKRFAQAVLAGSDYFDSVEIESTLVERAKGYTYERYHERLDKDGNVHRLKSLEHIPADVKAITLWLTNRMRGRWMSGYNPALNVNIGADSITGEIDFNQTDKKQTPTAGIKQTPERAANVARILYDAGAFHALSGQSLVVDGEVTEEENAA